MNKAEAKRKACCILATQISGGADVFLNTSGEEYTDDDKERLMAAFDELQNELFRRAHGR